MSKSQPILSFIEGIDERPGRTLTNEEVNQLTSTRNGQGDWFAQWLARTAVSERQLSLRAVISDTLPKDSYRKAFAVADGIPIAYDTKNTENPLNYISRSLRFVVIALPDSDATTPDLSLSVRTLCIVGSGNLDGTADGAFLQCASWDPNAFGKRKGLFRFYQRNNSAWLYFGDSFNAFNAKSSNHGPFDGHIAGALIMKELTSPWTHWYNNRNVNEFQTSLGSTRDKPSLCDRYNALYDPLFTPKHGSPFSLLGNAEDLEPIIQTSVRKWYLTRFSSDFVDLETKEGVSVISDPIKGWIGHILLSKAMNIAASPTSTAQVQQQAPIGVFPITLFLNLQALKVVLPDVAGSVQWNFTVENSDYIRAVNRLQLSLYYDDFSTKPPTRKLAVPGSEGPFAFPTIEPGAEDYQAVATLVGSLTAHLLPPKAIAAMLMIDFCNPMYSLKRSKLMTYLPTKATFDKNTKTYDVLPQFISNVKANHASAVEGTAEYEVLHLLDEPDDTWRDTFTTRVNNYLEKVHARLNGPDKAGAVEDYMILAEGRRRLYKGWEQSKPGGSGLDEFRMTLPIAARPDPFPLTEMTETGDILMLQPNLIHESVLLRWGLPCDEGSISKYHSHGGFVHRTGGCPAYTRTADTRL